MKKENQSVLIGVGITALVFIIIIISIFSSNKGTLNNIPTTNNATDSTVASTSQSQCDTATKNYFNTWQTKDNDSFKTVNLTYQNYYDSTNNGCYALVNYNYNAKDNPDSSYSEKITYSLVNVYQKDPYGNPETIGSYSQSVSTFKINNRLDTCSVSGQQCYSLDSFLSLVNPYLGK